MIFIFWRIITFPGLATPTIFPHSNLANQSLGIPLFTCPTHEIFISIHPCPYLPILHLTGKQNAILLFNFVNFTCIFDLNLWNFGIWFFGCDEDRGLGGFRMRSRSKRQRWCKAAGEGGREEGAGGSLCSDPVFTRPMCIMCLGTKSNLNSDGGTKLIRFFSFNEEKDRSFYDFIRVCLLRKIKNLWNLVGNIYL